MLQKLFCWTFYSSLNPEKLSIGFYKNIMQHNFSTFMIIRNVSWAPNQPIRMISEGPCDTDDWSNVCWKSSSNYYWIIVMLPLACMTNQVSTEWMFFCWLLALFLCSVDSCQENDSFLFLSVCYFLYSLEIFRNSYIFLFTFFLQKENM